MHQPNPIIHPDCVSPKHIDFFSSSENRCNRKMAKREKKNADNAKDQSVVMTHTVMS